MMQQPTLEKLYALRWFGLAEAWRKQMENSEVASLSFDERFGLLVDQHWTWRENQNMARRLKRSKLDTDPLRARPVSASHGWRKPLAQKACRDGYAVWYRPVGKLFRELMMARADERDPDAGYHRPHRCAGGR